MVNDKIISICIEEKVKMRFILIACFSFFIFVKEVYPSNELRLPEEIFTTRTLLIEDRPGERFGRNIDRIKSTSCFFDNDLDNGKTRLERETQRQRDMEEKNRLLLGANTGKNSEKKLHNPPRRHSISGEIGAQLERLNSEQIANSLFDLAEGYEGAHSRERHAAGSVDYLTNRSGPKTVTTFSTTSDQNRAYAQAKSKFIQDRDTFGIVTRNTNFSDVTYMNCLLDDNITSVVAERPGPIKSNGQPREGPTFIREMSGGTINIIKRNGMPYTVYPKDRW